ncbi:hypothetical protein [Kordiimonas marina]|uniref:hypothetical protein n=1 Tax=Kordiimonas marina TaxID=2872312 RepID=UPI001FF0E314|nr:hypothetical protein [Kordiimonas marina]MCJ9429239.1 hypothetical protein [Kordiimonas marina]
MLNIELNWQGPLKPGTYPKDLRTLAIPGVYLYVQRFPNVTALYAGKSMHLGKRFHQHLAGILGFQYWRRKDDPRPRAEYQQALEVASSHEKVALYAENEYAFTHPERNGLNQFNDLEKNVREAVQEVLRTNFYYCRVPKLGRDADCDLSPVPDLPASTIIAELEACLIKNVWDFADNQQDYVCDNSRHEPHSGKLTINSVHFRAWLKDVLT